MGIDAEISVLHFDCLEWCMYARKLINSISHRGSVFTIKMRLHYTWWFAFIFLTFFVATNVQTTISMWIRLGMGFGITLALMIFMIIRQIIMNFLIRSRGIPLRKVTLYVTGGVPGIPRLYTSPSTEFWLGIFGVLVNIGGLIVFYAIYIYLVIKNSNVLGNLMMQLIYLMALYNLLQLLPGLPMAGGRMLRALLWKVTKDYDRTTRITGNLGRIMALMIIAVGLFLIYTGQPWFLVAALILVGITNLIAANETLRTMRLRQYLLGTDLTEVRISRDFPRINPKMTIMELVRNYVLLKGNYFFITVDDYDNAINRVALTDIMKVRKKLWNSKTLESIGTPIEKTDYASIEQSAADILERMLDMDVTQTPIVKENKMIGLIDTDELLHLAALRRDLRFLTDSRQ